MSMNLPRYAKEVGKAHDTFRGDISEAREIYDKAMMKASNDLEEKLQALRTEFFEDEDDVAKESAPRKFA